MVVNNHSILFVLLFLAAIITIIAVGIIFFFEKNSLNFKDNNSENENNVSGYEHKEKNKPFLYKLPIIIYFSLLISSVAYIYNFSTIINKDETYNISFELNSFELKEEYLKLIEKDIVNQLKENARYKIIIESYTDNTASYEYNYNLSINRANEVKRVLVSKGISLNRIYVSNRGMNELFIYKDKKEEKENRRVVIKLVAYLS